PLPPPLASTGVAKSGSTTSEIRRRLSFMAHLVDEICQGATGISSLNAQMAAGCPRNQTGSPAYIEIVTLKQFNMQAKCSIRLIKRAARALGRNTSFALRAARWPGERSSCDIGGEDPGEACARSRQPWQLSRFPPEWSNDTDPRIASP